MKKNRLLSTEEVTVYEDKFVVDLEKLFGRFVNLTRKEFASFLGVSYVTYCNWRTGRYTNANKLPEYAIEGYLKLSTTALNDLLASRLLGLDHDDE